MTSNETWHEDFILLSLEGCEVKKQHLAGGTEKTTEKTSRQPFY
jgi:hypothetical protein